jgi:hypothetical protein
MRRLAEAHSRPGAVFYRCFRSCRISARNGYIFFPRRAPQRQFTIGNQKMPSSSTGRISFVIGFQYDRLHSCPVACTWSCGTCPADSTPSTQQPIVWTSGCKRPRHRVPNVTLARHRWLIVRGTALRQPANRCARVGSYRAHQITKRQKDIPRKTEHEQDTRGEPRHAQRG